MHRVAVGTRVAASRRVLDRHRRMALHTCRAWRKLRIVRVVAAGACGVRIDLRRAERHLVIMTRRAGPRRRLRGVRRVASLARRVGRRDRRVLFLMATCACLHRAACKRVRSVTRHARRVTRRLVGLGRSLMATFAAPSCVRSSCMRSMTVGARTVRSVRAVRSVHAIREGRTVRDVLARPGCRRNVEASMGSRDGLVACRAIRLYSRWLAVGVVACRARRAFRDVHGNRRTLALCVRVATQTRRCDGHSECMAGEAGSRVRLTARMRARDLLRVAVRASRFPQAEESAVPFVVTTGARDLVLAHVRLVAGTLADGRPRGGDKRRRHRRTFQERRFFHSEVQKRRDPNDRHKRKEEAMSALRHRLSAWH